VTLPTVSTESKPAIDIAAEVAALRAENERLRARLEMLEHAVAEHGVSEHEPTPSPSAR